MQKHSVKPVELNQEYTLVVNSHSHEGEGIGRINNFAIFVPGAIPGEEVKVKITEVKKSFARGVLKEIIVASKNRNQENCTLIDTCGGCSLQHMNYDAQLEMKKEIVESTLKKIGGIEIEVAPTIGMDEPVAYRNKGQFHVHKKDGQVTLGFYNKNSHDVMGTNNCSLFSEKINEIVVFLEEILTDEQIKVYNQKDKTGYLRNIVFRQSKETNEIMLIFVTNNKANKLNKIISLIEEKFPEVTSFFQNINPEPGPIILGKEFKLLKGKGLISDKLGSLDFAISPESFFQVNTEQAEKLYTKALEYAGLTGTETVVDAYCGIGTISLFMAKHAKKVYGIESVTRATEDAKFNAIINEVTNAEFIAAKIEKWLPKWVEEGNSADVIVVDPPRKGCDQETLQAMVEAKPGKIIYVSCNPSTLARDLKFIVAGGYEVKKVQPVDMFPLTSHVESIILMTSSTSEAKK
ncbi:23S rRNA (uracil1939-C5)-methyltransferase [Desulfonispora thiosulfatigenes DSM 11270]|uniref:23S rRNA (Uracil1939-C5)-methyltransferase n=1 Tax=Desulfonispora thiosulfatigenes DSM 11270 TaxID=656914 RepID=A0A1W1UG87_DESTI|nr:23S rRNA (uracil(1939)-C(5))-methyltransferase RlmD [Desulfonispora thiosulfatigenes]SMB80080.1 23S rRNA (uracil1939-C5)-methyltransferase [Desulfonispora thiosulfatigenes DSM 11270]